jgi:hypothetical protein
MHNKKMMLLMLLCCAIPLVAMFALPALGVSLGSRGYFLLILLCPAMHFLMMRGMHGKKQDTQEYHEMNSEEPAASGTLHKLNKTISSKEAKIHE